MIEFIKRNWLILFTSFFLGCLATLLFFFIVKSQNFKNSLGDNDRCANTASAYLLNVERNNSLVKGRNAVVLNEEFKFDTHLNTCIVYFEVSEIGSGITYNIYDVFTNKKLALYNKMIDQALQKYWDENCSINNGCYVNQDAFVAKHNELFK